MSLSFNIPRLFSHRQFCTVLYNDPRQLRVLVLAMIAATCQDVSMFCSFMTVVILNFKAILNQIDVVMLHHACWLLMFPCPFVVGEQVSYIIAYNKTMTFRLFIHRRRSIHTVICESVIFWNKNSLIIIVIDRTDCSIYSSWPKRLHRSGG